MKNFLSGLLTRASGPADPRRLAVSADIARLDTLKAGLGARATEYVLTGEPETVLSDLSILGGADQLMLGATLYARQDPCAFERRRVLVCSPAEDRGIVLRYLQVLAAATKTPPPALIGTEDQPLGLRILIHEAAHGLSVTRRDGQTLAPGGLWTAHLPDLAAELGAGPDALIALLYWRDATWSAIDAGPLRMALDLRGLLSRDPEAAVAGIATCPATGRIDFVGDVVRLGLAATPAFTALLLDMAGGGAKGPREAARGALGDLEAQVWEDGARERLAGGPVAMRVGMVDLLLRAGKGAALAAHLETEKNARVRAAIESGLAAAPTAAPDPEDEDGYLAVDGTHVALPPERVLRDSDPLPLTAAEQTALADGMKAENARIAALAAQAKTLGRKFWGKPLPSDALAEHVAAFRDGRYDPTVSRDGRIQRLWQCRATETIRSALDRQPPARLLTLAVSALDQPSFWWNRYSTDPYSGAIRAWAESEDADLRALERVWRGIATLVDLGGYAARVRRAPKGGDLLRALIPDDTFAGGDPGDIPPRSLWPYVAENLAVLDDAFGQGTSAEPRLDPLRALACLAALPKLPQRMVAPLLELATGTRKTGRAEARALLDDLPGLTERLVPLLDDGRQAICAGTAEWLGARGDRAAIAPIAARLKKEKSDIARAALLTALRRLGAPLDAYLGPDALSAEAEAGLRRAKLDKLDWLGLDALPTLEMKAGGPLPADVLRWWLFLAVKLKQPGGNALFELYLDQLTDASAEALGRWIVTSWIAHDTATPPEAEIAAHVERHAPIRVQNHYPPDPDMTLEKARAQLRREMMAVHPNSGTATKGLLGLATRIAPNDGAARVRAYLKAHGARTSQAASLLDMLAAKGDPVSLQVLIAAATRLKQKGVQAHAGALVQEVADRLDWSLEELGDRTIPTGGFDETGGLDLPCGPEGRVYRARLTEDLTVDLTNPDGKTVKALSSGTDEATKASKKRLSAARKELKQIIALQTGRLHEALCAGRRWSVEAWTRDFAAHPVMARLVQRLVWQALDADGAVLATFRPTAEGGLTDAEDGDVALDAADGVRLAHGALMAPDEAAAWVAHLADYEVAPLFAQFGRPLLRAPEDADRIADREGWVLEAYQLRGAAGRLGYERGPTEDGGVFTDYRKPFRAAGLTAAIAFTGNYLPEENHPVALLALRFEIEGRRTVVPLSEVPEVLLSECWNDFHEIAAKGAHDPAWKARVQW